MRKEFLIDCHCEECNDEAIHIPKWIAALPTVARNDGKRAAFTLAEVLITLTIIGVIAAITIPNLMQKHKKTEVGLKLKQIYSKMQNVTQMAIAQSGLEPEDWLNAEEKDMSLNDKREIIYTKYIKPYLKTNNFNKSTGTFYDETGVKYTLSASENANQFFKQTANHDYKYLLANLVVDINGNKGPNKNGIDIFYFTYKVNNQGPFNHRDQKMSFVPLTCGCTLTQNGRRYNSFEQYKENVYHNPGTVPHCNPTKNSDTRCCAEVIMYENWQIKDDYPFKKF